jgi:hypothetical protein
MTIEELFIEMKLCFKMLFYTAGAFLNGSTPVYSLPRDVI